ncbi:hypothetical protein K437DRAFT_22141 [Tilletiaria anomala UBC 951]|uniref:ornithine decarboxylase n=1 Tax=Tilletiaria anomala (strain ATCC 24038 / CBS 436.72 / UBC 951) TaxID=1037660 RepID=A0A066VIL0_TILAU|nr:uncharacterized protein K437DRAFT_22141 [Tilletiaria anomala UBC 951]KDN38569.1 hypothetical protein K437DRAFT_22141 [Tilletiaria anomala UBC 951]
MSIGTYLMAPQPILPIIRWHSISASTPIAHSAYGIFMATISVLCLRHDGRDTANDLPATLKTCSASSLVELFSLYDRNGHWPLDIFDSGSMAVRIHHPVNASATPEQQYALTIKAAQFQYEHLNTQSHSISDSKGTAAKKQLIQPKALQHTDPKLKTPIFLGSTTDQLRATLGLIDVDECEADGESAFFIADLAEVYRQHLRWTKELPRIVPFYAVKCNPDPNVLRLLAALGTGFDCASNGEIQNVLDIGVSPSRIIYANPCKASSFVRQAARQGIAMTTFDNLDELNKMKKFHPKCKLVVRILTDDSKSVCQLGLKFGAPLDSVPRLLARARELELDVVGVSFHVGSGCYDPESFRDAVRRARIAFQMGKVAGYTFGLLDVGGGYDHSNFEMIAKVLRTSLDEFFPLEQFGAGGSEMREGQEALRIIAEPGRYYVQCAFVLAANIIARRDGRSDVDDLDDAMEQSSTPDTDCTSSTAVDSIEPQQQDKPQVMLYQNDGMYGAFNCIMFDHQIVHPKVLTLRRQFAYRPDLEAPGVAPVDESTSESPDKLLVESDDNQLIPCSVWGPTCDSIDCVRDLAYLPKGLNVGDWLVYENMGAYTICAASSFNGLRRSEVRYTVGAEGEDADAVKNLLSLVEASESS